MPLLFWRALIFLAAVAASGTAFYWLARRSLITVPAPYVLRGVAVLLSATTILLCSYALFSAQVAESTMSWFRAALIEYACVRNRITSFPNKECGVTWFAALKYRVAKLRVRLSKPRPQGVPCGDEYSVYAAAINNDFWHLVPHTGQLMVLEDSTSYSWGVSSPPGWPAATVLAELFWEAEPSTVDAFLEANQAPALIEPFATELPTAILPRPLLDSLRAASTFYDRYPTAKGQFTLSRPGISSDHRQAFLEFHAHWGDYSGGGGSVLLTCKDGRWNLADSLIVRVP
jgi:hypothetical protein